MQVPQSKPIEEYWGVRIGWNRAADAVSCICGVFYDGPLARDMVLDAYYHRDRLKGTFWLGREID